MSSGLRSAVSSRRNSRFSVRISSSGSSSYPRATAVEAERRCRHLRSRTCSDGVPSPRKAPSVAVWKGATSEKYRAEHPDEFEEIVHSRLADSPSPSAYYEQMQAGARFDISGSVEGITAPALVVHGGEDRFVPPANAAALAQALPDAKLRVLGEAGHLVFIERFADVNREVVNFLKPRKPRRREAEEKGSFEELLAGCAGVVSRTGKRLSSLIKPGG